MERNSVVPDRCDQCPHCQIQGDSGYYPHLLCIISLREVSFNEKNGWERMRWCPLLFDSLKEGDVS